MLQGGRIVVRQPGCLHHTNSPWFPLDLELLHSIRSVAREGETNNPRHVSLYNRFCADETIELDEFYAAIRQKAEQHFLDSTGKANTTSCMFISPFRTKPGKMFSVFPLR